MSDLCHNCGDCHLGSDPRPCQQPLQHCGICNSKGHTFNFCPLGVYQVDAEYKFWMLCHNCDAWHLPQACRKQMVECPECRNLGHLPAYCPTAPRPRLPKNDGVDLDHLVSRVMSGKRDNRSGVDNQERAPVTHITQIHPDLLRQIQVEAAKDVMKLVNARGPHFAMRQIQLLSGSTPPLQNFAPGNTYPTRQQVPNAPMVTSQRVQPVAPRRSAYPKVLISPVPSSDAKPSYGAAGVPGEMQDRYQRGLVFAQADANPDHGATSVLGEIQDNFEGGQSVGNVDSEPDSGHIHSNHDQLAEEASGTPTPAPASEPGVRKPKAKARRGGGTKKTTPYRCVACRKARTPRCNHGRPGAKPAADNATPVDPTAAEGTTEPEENHSSLVGCPSSYAFPQPAGPSQDEDHHHLADASISVPTIGGFFPQHSDPNNSAQYYTSGDWPQHTAHEAAQTMMDMHQDHDIWAEARAAIDADEERLAQEAKIAALDTFGEGDAHNYSGDAGLEQAIEHSDLNPLARTYITNSPADTGLPLAGESAVPISLAQAYAHQDLFDEENANNHSPGAELPHSGEAIVANPSAQAYHHPDVFDQGNTNHYSPDAGLPQAGENAVSTLTTQDYHHHELARFRPTHTIDYAHVDHGGYAHGGNGNGMLPPLQRAFTFSSDGHFVDAGYTPMNPYPSQNEPQQAQGRMDSFTGMEDHGTNETQTNGGEYHHMEYS